MSTSFWSDCKKTMGHKDEPCLCAQMSECFGDAFENGVEPHTAELARNASPRCSVCRGTGIERVAVSDEPALNFSNMNAAAVLAALGLAETHDGSEARPGMRPMPEIRRAIIRAANRDLSRFTFAEEAQHGRPREMNGVVEMRPVRRYAHGLDEVGLRQRLLAFERFVAACVERGAKHIFWG